VPQKKNLLTWTRRSCISFGGRSAYSAPAPATLADKGELVEFWITPYPNTRHWALTLAAVESDYSEDVGIFDTLADAKSDAEDVARGA
jgi:hypothetical protein